MITKTVFYCVAGGRLIKHFIFAGRGAGPSGGGEPSRGGEPLPWVRAGGLCSRGAVTVGARAAIGGTLSPCDR